MSKPSKCCECECEKDYSQGVVQDFEAQRNPWSDDCYSYGDCYPL